MDPVLIAVVEGFVHPVIIEPPKLALFHPDFLILGLKPGPGRGLEHKMIPVPHTIIFAAVDMRINALARRQADDLGAAGERVEPVGDFFQIGTDEGEAL